MYSCPKCGGVLRLRTARRGDNAGKQFYGCSNWRKDGGGCGFSADKSDWEREHPDVTEPSPPMPTAASDVSHYPQVPVALNARAKFKTHTAKFFQALALPRAVLAGVESEGEAARLSWERY